MSYIEIRGVTKTFKNANKEETRVLKGIDLDIEKGDIYGIIGFSGAGKSTLIRCINGLDKPDSERKRSVESSGKDRNDLPTFQPVAFQKCIRKYRAAITI